MDICNILKEAAEEKIETSSQADIEPEESIYSGGFISSKDEAIFPFLDELIIPIIPFPPLFVTLYS